MDHNSEFSAEYWEENSLLYSGLNPLQIPHIVQSIFQEFSYSELKTLRLVCRCWEYEASLLLRNRTQVRFPSEKHIKEYLTHLSSNYCCESYELNCDIPLNSPSAREFFHLFGSDITFLKLHQITWTGPELWELLAGQMENLKELSIRIHIPSSRHGHFIPQGLSPEEAPPSLYPNNLPKLRWLKLNFTIERQLKATPPPSMDVTHPQILFEIFQAFPNIEELTCPNWPVIIPPKMNVSSLVFNIITNPETPQLKLQRLSKMHINANLNDIGLFQLMNKNFPLQELRLEVHPDMKGYALYFLLQSLDKTLKTLILTFRCGGYDERDFDDFPILRNLRYLALHQYYGPLDFVLKCLPGLKTLLLNDIIMENGIHKPIRQHTGVEELIFEGRNFNALAQLYILSKMFPNLKKLRVENVDDTMLRVIFMKLPLLEVLYCDGNFTDEGVSGIPADIAQNIFEVEDVESVRIYPYIGRLKYLRRLVLSSNSLTYLAVLLGVNDCKSLKVKRISSAKILRPLTNSSSSMVHQAHNFEHGLLL
ncbi:hypothetical protein Ocin01_16708 [Orchesella cincta]|uniref:F-box domain-containing protein n=1 Tax=Orchesella cincta TaxID=48709 RepID=A0A1D2MAP1_ORCCI|nr:hypothetical protein Ocin01_16708 [Orchesella cincta]